MRMSVNTQQAEKGIYAAIRITIPKESTPILDNVTFQISPNDKLSVVDIHNFCIRLFAKHEILYNISGAIAQDATVFIREKYAANFVKQFNLYCNDILITSSLGFVYEINIRGAICSNLIKKREKKYILVLI